MKFEIKTDRKIDDIKRGNLRQLETYCSFFDLNGFVWNAMKAAIGKTDHSYWTFIDAVTA